MAIHRTRKNKENAHYGFLVSWEPSQGGVKGETATNKKIKYFETSKTKKADYLAQEVQIGSIKKDIFKSLILIGFMLATEVVVYLARNSFIK